MAALGFVPPPIGVHSLLTQTSFEALPALALVLLAGGYLLGVWRLRRRGDDWPWGRVAAWLGAVVVTGYVLIGGLAAYDETLFSAHMAQHMVLTMATPVLLALGAPITLALRVLPVRARKGLICVLQSRLGRLLSSPLLGFGLFVATPFALYFSGLYAYTLDHPWAHYLSHVHFVVVGCLFFWPILGLDPLPHPPPHWARVMVIFLALPFHAFLGLAIMSSTRVIAVAHYAAIGRTWGASSLADQGTAGGLIWGTGDLVGVLLFVIVLVQWANADEREARRVDRALDRAEAAEAADAVRLGPGAPEVAAAEPTGRLAEDAAEAAELAVYNARLAALAERGQRPTAGR